MLGRGTGASSSTSEVTTNPRSSPPEREHTDLRHGGPHPPERRVRRYGRDSRIGKPVADPRGSAPVGNGVSILRAQCRASGEQVPGRGVKNTQGVASTNALSVDQVRESGAEAGGSESGLTRACSSNCSSATFTVEVEADTWWAAAEGLPVSVKYRRRASKCPFLANPERSNRE
jgi:hypothetical protein